MTPFALLLVIQALPTFEAATVKPSTSKAPTRATTTPDRLTYQNVTLHNVIARAYRVKEHQLEGPDWLRTERYDIVAKAPDNTPKDQIPLMLQSLLSERFQFKFHHEQKEMAVYWLIRGKKALKVEKTDGPLGYAPSSERLVYRNFTMAQLSDSLTLNSTQLPVFDHTGLEETYTFPLEHSLEEGFSNGPSIFTIIESLGLKLEPLKQPIDILIIDAATKTPTAN